MHAIAAEFDYYCLGFDEDKLSFSSLKEGLEFRFFKFVRECYIDCVKPVFRRHLQLPFRNRIRVNSIFWKYRDKQISPTVLAKILDCLQEFPYSFQMCKTESSSSSSSLISKFDSHAKQSGEAWTPCVCVCVCVCLLTL